MTEPADAVTVMVHVRVPPPEAFAVFTEDIDQWWRRGPAYRVAGRSPGTFHLEPRLGGRLFESYRRGEQELLHEAGTITAFDPPALLAFEWRASNFQGDEVTFVEVRFAARGEGTDVTLVHSGWAALRPDHPVRHGEDTAKFLRTLGSWWGQLLTALRVHTLERGPGGEG